MDEYIGCTIFVYDVLNVFAEIFRRSSCVFFKLDDQDSFLTIEGI